MTPESVLANWDLVVDHSDFAEFTRGDVSLGMVQTARENAEHR
jgi:hypothetical protein